MTTVIPFQSFFDIAIQEDGSVSAAFDWAVANGISITDELFPAQKLIAPNSEYRYIEVANYFKGKQQMLATGFNLENIDFPMEPTGIDYMIIGTDFIVA